MKIEVSPGQDVQITVLDASKESVRGRVASSAGHYLTISSDNPLPADAIVRVSWANFLILGEVYGFLENKHMVVIHIRHAIALQDISEIRSRWV